MSSCPLSIDSPSGNKRFLAAIVNFFLYTGTIGSLAAIVNGIVSSIFMGSFSLLPSTAAAISTGITIITLASSLDMILHAIKSNYATNRILIIAKYAFLFFSAFSGLVNLGGTGILLTHRIILSIIPVSLDYFAMTCFYHKINLI